MFFSFEFDNFMVCINVFSVFSIEFVSIWTVQKLLTLAFTTLYNQKYTQKDTYIYTFKRKKSIAIDSLGRINGSNATDSSIYNTFKHIHILTPTLFQKKNTHFHRLKHQNLNKFTHTYTDKHTCTNTRGDLG